MQLFASSFGKKNSDNVADGHTHDVFNTVLNVLGEGAKEHAQSVRRGGGSSGNRPVSRAPPTPEQKAAWEVNGHRYAQVGKYDHPTNGTDVNMDTINAMIRERGLCKRDRRYDDADAIRADLGKMGIKITDKDNTWQFQ